MSKSKQTKKMLFSSVIALILCFSMLLGTTFAWFTDTVESGINKIQAGNLDIELEYAVLNADGTVKEWKSVQGAETLFSSNLWEPGHTEVVYLKLSNQGTLALKYQLGINVTETVGINVAGNPFKLSDYIYMGVVEGAVPTFTSREKAIEEAKKGTNGIIGNGYSKSGTMLEGAEDLYMALVVYMPESVGNEANYKTGTNAPVINMGIELFATQQMNESDSFDPDYDKGAAWTGAVNTEWYNDTDKEFTLTTAEQLAGLAEIVNSGKDSFAGKTVKLDADMDLNNVNWTPIGVDSNKFVGTFIGTGYTISNLRVVGGKALGLFGKTFTGAHIEGVTIDTAYVSGNDYVGAILGQGYLGHNCIVDCTVTNATIIATPYFDSNKGVYDGGAKAGVIAGQAYNGNITGCTAKNSTVTAYRDLGGIAGMHDFDGKAGSTVEASDNTVENVTLSYIGVAGAYDGNKSNENMAAVVGRVGAKATVGTNTVTNVIMNKDNEGATMIFTLDELIKFAANVNAGNTYKGKTVILGADIDLANMEWTPIGNSTYSFQGIFDGNGKTVSNLNVNMPGKSNVGLFGMTTVGEIKNLTVENAVVTGRLNVGVVAGTPYTSKYTNITVKGHVEVNGMSYVGGVGGKNAYANWTDVTVDVDETSYVKAISTENGVAFRTYVGGVTGFNGEGGHTFKNITSNIDVIGDVCDIGGVFGIAHYNNKFENITCTGDVTNLISSSNDGDDAAIDVLETGLIAGVWHNQNGTTVEFTNVSATGKILTPNVVPAEDFHNEGLVGKAYEGNGTGELIIVNFIIQNGIEYAMDVVNGDVTLYKVPSDYEGDTVNVAEGTTAIGNSAFAYNSNVKEVVLASTVRDLGRGFDSSTVEKVVLNEGLTTISSRAFKSTTALKQVVIPSTVTVIEDNAFQKSGIKEIVIPASVETIGETAFGASLIETVTFEGDIEIQGYAFRGCTALRTVNMKGYNVTFVKSTLNGRDSMWFCNGESNNPNTSSITFYVKNEEIKARVLEAMGAEAGNTTVYCEQNSAANGVYGEGDNTYAYASNVTTMSEAITNGAKTVYLSAGNYVIPAAAKGKTLTIVGSGDTSVAVTKVGIGGENCDYGLDGSTVVFENVTITTNSSTYIGYARCKATFNNCTFNGTYTLYDDSTFNNCTFTVSGDGYNVWTWGARNATFNDCTFNNDG